MFSSDYISQESHGLESDGLLRLWGFIRWDKSLGRPPGDDPCCAFKVIVEEHVQPRTSGGFDDDNPNIMWAPCQAAPDEDNDYVCRFHVPAARFTQPFEGRYIVEVKLERDHWPQPEPNKMITPLSRRIIRVDGGLPIYKVNLTKEAPIATLGFRVINDTTLIVSD